MILKTGVILLAILRNLHISALFLINPYHYKFYGVKIWRKIVLFNPLQWYLLIINLLIIIVVQYIFIIIICPFLCILVFLRRIKKQWIETDASECDQQDINEHAQSREDLREPVRFNEERKETQIIPVVLEEEGVFPPVQMNNIKDPSKRRRKADGNQCFMNQMDMFRRNLEEIRRREENNMKNSDEESYDCRDSITYDRKSIQNMLQEDIDALKKTGLKCSICLEEMEKDHRFFALSCAHLFHKECIQNWFDRGHRTCPNCKHKH
ncbi:unnamed protein product [Moneuplotes crassus]|uniref:RING-type domain-containing protein n=1 Tax=Euplotes crassus TaxID=5936 RepID=A0AAD1UEN2_EUPCR|nr:unnamed protein product [Moneuplotes crassus]